MPDEIPDFDVYAELEVSERASAETIQAAFRSLQLRNHPDRVGAAAGARAVRLNIAHDWLLDPDRRSRYDEYKADAKRRAGQTAGGVRDAGLADDAADTHASRPETEVVDEADVDTADGNTELDASDRGPLAATHLLLRLDLARLVRVWIVGLAFLGALDLWAQVAVASAARVAATVATLLVLLALTTRRIRTSRDAGLLVRAKRTGWSLLGWLGLALLAAEGVSAALTTTDVPAPVLAATAAMSLTAVRRRAGPVRASVDDFLAMTPTEFETAVGQVLGRHGYRLRRTGGPGDLAADLVGTDASGKSTVVQCKRYAPGHPVGSRDVQLLIAMGMRHHGAERLVLVTTSDFTDPAIDLAEEHDVRLIAGDELEDLTR